MGTSRAELCGQKKPQVRKAKKGGWTEAKRRTFIAELAATCNVAAALRKVKMSDTSVYVQRRRSAEFRAQWAEALREGYAKLELMLLERAMNGTVKTVTRPDGSVDKTHEYPNAVALSLLRMHKESVATAEADEEATDVDEVRARVLRKLMAVKKRLEKKNGAAPAAHPRPLPQAGGEEEGALPQAGGEEEGVLPQAGGEEEGALPLAGGEEEGAEAGGCAGR